MNMKSPASRRCPVNKFRRDRVFSVLWGTLLLDYETEEEAKSSVCPKLISEVVGISEWEGQGKSNQFPYGFLIVTHTGGTYYLSAYSLKERIEWLTHVRRALECCFANDAVKDYKPCKYIQPRPKLSSIKYCAKTKIPLTINNAIPCRSCGRLYSSTDYVSDMIPFLQIGIEEYEKCCIECKNTQLCIIWLKQLNYSHVMNLHEMTPKVQEELTTNYKATFKLQQKISKPLDMAAKLYDQKSITLDEFKDLQRLATKTHYDELYESGIQLKNALEVLGEDMQMIISLILKHHSYENGNRIAFIEIVYKILSIADDEPDLIDFYLPQLLQVHLLESMNRKATSMYKVDLLQQMLLVLVQKYPALALKITWLLLATINDYNDKKATQVQYASCMCLLLQLEMCVNNGILSCIADVTLCQTLANILKPSNHQKQELGLELSNLFLIRRRLQEVYDEEKKLHLPTTSTTTTTGAVGGREMKADSINSVHTISTYPDSQNNSSSTYSDQGLSSDKLEHLNSETGVPSDKLEPLNSETGVPSDKLEPLNSETGVPSDKIVHKDVVHNIEVNSSSTSSSSSTFSPPPPPPHTVVQQITRHDSSFSLHPPLDSPTASYDNLFPTISDDVEDQRLLLLHHHHHQQQQHQPIHHFFHPSSCIELFNQLGVGKANYLPPQSPTRYNYASTSTRVPGSTDISNKDSAANVSTGSGGGSGTIMRANSSDQYMVGTGRLSVGTDAPLDSHRSTISTIENELHTNYNKQIDFIHKLTHIVDALRYVERNQRTETLIHELNKLNQLPDLLGWDPCSKSGEPGYRIVRIITEDCRVFRTKARAPSLIICEVIRQDLDHSEYLQRWRDCHFDSKRYSVDDDDDDNEERHNYLHQLQVSYDKSIPSPVKTTAHHHHLMTAELSHPASPVDNNNNTTTTTNATSAGIHSHASSVDEGDEMNRQGSTKQRRVSMFEINHDYGISDVSGIIDSNISKAIADIQKAKAMTSLNPADMEPSYSLKPPLIASPEHESGTILSASSASEASAQVTDGSPYSPFLHLTVPPEQQKFSPLMTNDICYVDSTDSTLGHIANNTQLNTDIIIQTPVDIHHSAPSATIKDNGSDHKATTAGIKTDSTIQGGVRQPLSSSSVSTSVDDMKTKALNTPTNDSHPLPIPPPTSSNTTTTTATATGMKKTSSVDTHIQKTSSTTTTTTTIMPPPPQTHTRAHSVDETSQSTITTNTATTGTKKTSSSLDKVIKTITFQEPLLTPSSLSSTTNNTTTAKKTTSFFSDFLKTTPSTASNSSPLLHNSNTTNTTTSTATNGQNSSKSGTNNNHTNHSSSSVKSDIHINETTTAANTSGYPSTTSLTHKSSSSISSASQFFNSMILSSSTPSVTKTQSHPLHTHPTSTITTSTPAVNPYSGKVHVPVNQAGEGMEAIDALYDLGNMLINGPAKLLTSSQGTMTTMKTKNISSNSLASMNSIGSSMRTTSGGSASYGSIDGERLLKEIRKNALNNNEKLSRSLHREDHTPKRMTLSSMDFMMASTATTDTTNTTTTGTTSNTMNNNGISSMQPHTSSTHSITYNSQGNKSFNSINNTITTSNKPPKAKNTSGMSSLSPVSKPMISHTDLPAAMHSSSSINSVLSSASSSEANLHMLTVKTAGVLDSSVPASQSTSSRDGKGSPSSPERRHSFYSPQSLPMYSVVPKRKQTSSLLPITRKSTTILNMCMPYSSNSSVAESTSNASGSGGGSPLNRSAENLLNVGQKSFKSIISSPSMLMNLGKSDDSQDDLLRLHGHNHSHGQGGGGHDGKKSRENSIRLLTGGTGGALALASLSAHSSSSHRHHHSPLHYHHHDESSTNALEDMTQNTSFHTAHASQQGADGTDDGGGGGEEEDDDSYDKQQLSVQASARALLDSGAINIYEYQEIVNSDTKYRQQKEKEVAEITLSKVESAFGELWAVKKQRILGIRSHTHSATATTTNHAGGQHDLRTYSGDEIENDYSGDRFWPVWDLRCFIVKSNDDLRQEICCLQLMKLCNEIFHDFGLSSQLYLKPYRIVSTSSTSGIVQVLSDSMSLDALKKTKGFINLPHYFQHTYGNQGLQLTIARRNFAASLAAYSLFTYILYIKDRHNGNILIDTEGHIIHIDFGFMLSIAPGGYLSLETAPFKLTEEMVEVLGGLESKMFGEFVKAFTAGFLALRANADSLITNLQVLSINSPYPCFHGKDTPMIIEKLRGRFRTDLSVNDAVHHCLDLIISSYGHYGTKQYDSFQYYTNGIIP